MVNLRKSTSQLSISQIRNLVQRNTATQEEMCKLIGDWWVEEGLKNSYTIDEVYFTASNLNNFLAMYRDAKSYWLRELGLTSTKTIEDVKDEDCEMGMILRDEENVPHIYGVDGWKPLQAMYITYK